MKIIVSQQGKKLLVSFKHNNAVDNYSIDKAENFLAAIDKFIKKRKINPISLIGHIEFKNTGVLTERVIRAIVLGFKFSYSEKIE